jgi:hypothetical protein
VTIFDSDLWTIVWLTVRVAGAALLLSALLGVPLGTWLALARFRGKRVVSALVYTGMGLPPGDRPGPVRAGAGPGGLATCPVAGGERRHSCPPGQADTVSGTPSYVLEGVSHNLRQPAGARHRPTGGRGGRSRVFGGADRLRQEHPASAVGRPGAADGRLVGVADTEKFFSSPCDPRTTAFVRGEIVYG